MKVTFDRLKAFIHDAMIALGLPDEDAAVVAGLMASADLQGSDGMEVSHDPDRPGRRFDAILVDIDHSPERLLAPQSESFYQPDGLRRVVAHLHPGGVFGLWSDDRPDDAFTQRLAAVFAQAQAEAVTFYNPLQNCDFTQTVYIARTAG